MTSTAKRWDELEQLAWRLLAHEAATGDDKLSSPAQDLLEYFKTHGVPPIHGEQLDPGNVPRVLASAVRLSRPVYWRSGQWAITAYGLECTDGDYDYHVAHEVLLDMDWLEHIGEKTGAHKDELARALKFARDNYTKLWGTK